MGYEGNKQGSEIGNKGGNWSGSGGCSAEGSLDPIMVTVCPSPSICALLLLESTPVT